MQKTMCDWGAASKERTLAGKTTILYRLQVGEVISTIPTIGFNVETVTYKNIKFQVWDLGGQTGIRPYWRCYYPNTQVRTFTMLYEAPLYASYKTAWSLQLPLPHRSRFLPNACHALL
jgi:hypothetical protein